MARNPFIPGVFVPTTNIWDVNEIYSIDVNSPEFKELLVRLYQNINVISLALNVKETGIYGTNEQSSSQSWFPNPLSAPINPDANDLRQGIRQVIITGGLPNTGLKSIPHNVQVTPTMTLTRLYGAATNGTPNSFIPLPYASPVLANNIELNADANNINIITGSNRTAYIYSVVVMEFLKT